MKHHKLLLLSTSGLTFVTALGALMPAPAYASCLAVSTDTTISNSSASCVTWTGGNISITTNGVLTTNATAVTNTSNSAVNLTNSGTISAISSGNAILNNGTIGTITNSGTIVNSGSASGIDNGGLIGLVSNSGTISGANSGIYTNSSIGTIINSGTISGFNGISISGSVGTIANSGTISGLTAILNSGSINAITNSRAIGGNTSGIRNSGSIGTITNSGIIGGTRNAAIFNSSGTIGTVINSGTISGHYGIYNSGSIGTINNNANGTLSGPAADGVFNVSLIDQITNSGTISGHYGIYNTGSMGTLVNNTGGMINGSTGGIGLLGGSTIGLIMNAAGATITSDAYAIADSGVISIINNAGLISNTGTVTSVAIAVIGSDATIINAVGGTISGYDTAIANNGGSIGTISNAGTITGLNFAGISNTSSIGQISNGGTISGLLAGIYNQTGGTIGQITNQGAMSGAFGISNAGNIGTIANTGVISVANNTAISNYGTIGQITNTGTLSGGGGDAISNGGAIGTIMNDGLMQGGADGIYNNGSIGQITNNGAISGGPFGDGGGIENLSGDTIGTITNNGTINGGTAAINNSGTIGTITNNGTISNIVAGIVSGAAATIGQITNNGLISAPNAIFASFTTSGTAPTILSALSNAGTIAGNIVVAQALTITGGRTGALGTLTGYNGTIGTITTGDNDLTFDARAFQLLDDDINVGSGNTVRNSGLIQVNTTHSITGNYTQSAGGTLAVGVTDASHYGDLVVSGAVSMVNSNISIVSAAAGALKAGESFTIVQAAGAANYSGVNATAFDFITSTRSISSGGYNDLIVSLTQGHAYQSIGNAVSPNASVVGNALDQAVANGSTSLAPILTALNTLGQQQGGAAQGAALKQLAPNQLGPQLSSSTVLVNQGAGVIAEHQQSLMAANTGGAVGRAAGSEYKSGIFWGQVSGGIANGNQGAAVGGYGQNSYGLTAGTDFKVGKQTSLGIALAYLHANAWGTGALSGSDLLTNSVQLTGYGSQRLGPAFVDGMLGVGYNHFDQNRAIDFLGTSASAGYGGMQYMARAEAGWDIPLPARVTFTPVAGFEATRMDNDAYSESGAGAADLSVGRQIIDSYATTLGFRAATVLPTVLGSLQPQFKLGWIHDLNNNAVSSNSTLDGVSFTTASPRIAPDGVQTGLAVSLQRSDNLTLSAAYNLEARQGFLSNDGLLKASLKF